MLAENLFTDLDAEDMGKIHKSEIRNALVHMGVEMGVPPFTGLFQFSCFLCYSDFFFQCEMSKHECNFCRT